MNMQRSRTLDAPHVFAVSCASSLLPAITWAAVVDAADAYGQASPSGDAVCR